MSKILKKLQTKNQLNSSRSTTCVKDSSVNTLHNVTKWHRRLGCRT